MAKRRPTKRSIGEVKLTNNENENVDVNILETKSKLIENKYSTKTKQDKCILSSATSTEDYCAEGKEALGNKKEEGTTNIKDSKLITKNVETIWQPNNWQETLENIRKMRSSMVAPVDTMGCHKCHDQNADEKTQRFQILVALMLSSQTKDEITYHAMKRLKEQTLTPQSIVAMKLNVLENILHPVSFYKSKAKYIQQTAKVLIEEYNSDIPDNVVGLIALPGVGPKMAHICMCAAWNKVTGIGVDVHVHRICNRLGWTPKSTNVPEQTRIMLEEWLPRDLWSEVNHLLVGFGQTICTPVKPNCFNCLNNHICPYAISNNLSNKNIIKIDGQLLDVMQNGEFKKSKIKIKKTKNQ